MDLLLTDWGVTGRIFFLTCGGGASAPAMSGSLLGDSISPSLCSPLAEIILFPLALFRCSWSPCSSVMDPLLTDLGVTGGIFLWWWSICSQIFCENLGEIYSQAYHKGSVHILRNNVRGGGVTAHMMTMIMPSGGGGGAPKGSPITWIFLH